MIEITFPGGDAVDAGLKGQTIHTDDKRLDSVRIELRLPPGFPEKYRQAIVRAVDQCAVKRAIADPPRFEIEVYLAPTPRHPERSEGSQSSHPEILRRLRGSG